MVNFTESAKIPLDGRGFCHRPGGNYGPGEYKRLVNMELTDQGTLKRRLPVQKGIDADLASNGRFLGHLEKWMVYGGKDTYDSYDPIRYTYHDGLTFINSYPTWTTEDIYSVADPDPDSDSHQVAHFFRFNGRNYWLSISNSSPGTIDRNKFFLHNFTAGTNEDVATLPAVWAHDIPQVVTHLFTVDLDGHGMFGMANFGFIKAFWFRQRYWIVNSTGIWYSKPGEPQTFAAPDGGFFLFPDDRIKDVVALHDKIYVLGQNDISYISYNTDPGDADDVQQVVIAQGIGGDALCAFEDEIYMARLDQLYLVEPSRVSKVLDLDLGYGPQGPNVQLTPFMDYIIICFRQGGYSDFDPTDWNGTLSPAISPSGYVDDSAFGTSGEKTPFFTSTFWINMKNSSVFEFEYTQHEYDPSVDPANSNEVAQPCDWYFHPYEQDNGQYYVWFACNAAYNDETELPTRVYSIRSMDQDSLANDYGVDFAWYPTMSSNIAWWKPIPTLIEIDSYTPDDSELQVKKFRSMVMEGEFPTSPGDSLPGPIDYNALNVFFAYDNEDYGPGLDISAAANFNINSRLPTPLRVPLNQRARSVSIKLLERGFPGTSASPIGGTYEVSIGPRYQVVNLGMLWTPTKRAPIRATSSSEM